ncbi:hypothetical protein DMN91_011011 [Ooceraea biroi]|uniref:Uncharacterized protein n=1 Tax=Ooceraea biroi TaxID=2015173 RepID=A0A3L8D9W9_OOCBI|nr:hypothetical protein DMN91_011011 [Ooceraea biroi]
MRTATPEDITKHEPDSPDTWPRGQPMRIKSTGPRFRESKLPNSGCRTAVNTLGSGPRLGHSNEDVKFYVKVFLARG